MWTIVNTLMTGRASRGSLCLSLYTLHLEAWEPCQHSGRPMVQASTFLSLGVVGYVDVNTLELERF